MFVAFSFALRAFCIVSVVYWTCVAAEDLYLGRPVADAAIHGP